MSEREPPRSSGDQDRTWHTEVERPPSQPSRPDPADIGRMVLRAAQERDQRALGRAAITQSQRDDLRALGGTAVRAAERDQPDATRPPAERPERDRTR